MHSGKHFFGFEAGDADRFMLCIQEPTTRYIKTFGSNEGQNKYRITGRFTLEEITEQSEDWENFKAKGGMVFNITVSELSQLDNLLRDCAEETIDLVDMSNY